MNFLLLAILLFSNIAENGFVFSKDTGISKKGSITCTSLSPNEYYQIIMTIVTVNCIQPDATNDDREVFWKGQNLEFLGKFCTQNARAIPRSIVESRPS